MIFEVPTSVLLKSPIFLDVKPCWFVPGFLKTAVEFINQLCRRTLSSVFYIL